MRDADRCDGAEDGGCRDEYTIITLAGTILKSIKCYPTGKKRLLSHKLNINCCKTSIVVFTTPCYVIQTMSWVANTIITIVSL